MSLDTGWNTTTLRGTDVDGEGLVEQGDGTIRQTRETDVWYASERHSGDVEEETQNRNGPKGW